MQQQQLDVPQVTWICVVFAAAGGAMEVLATALLAYRDAREQETGEAWSRAASLGALAGNVALQMTSSVLGNLIAPWFGPVSIVGPMFLCAQLFANMVVFGYLLGLESFNKDMRIGTLVVVIGCVLLPIVGPTAQENQDAAALLHQWHVTLWSALLVMGMLLSAALFFVVKLDNLSELWRMAWLIVARATAFSVNLTVSKVMILDVSTFILVVCIVLKITSGLIITGALIVQASAVPQKKFVPLNASCLILINAVTGMIVWQDYKVVQDWIGYSCVFVQLILGNYLLMGDIPMLSPENTKYGRAKALKMASVVVRRGKHAWLDEAELASMEDEKEPRKVGFVSLEGEQGEMVQAPVRRQRRPSSARVAWSSVYGINPDDDRFVQGRHRQKSIFFIDEEVPEEIEQRGSF